MVGAAANENTGFLLGQTPDDRRLEPKQIVGGYQVGACGRGRIFRDQGLDDLIKQLFSRPLVGQVKIAFPDPALIGSHLQYLFVINVQAHPLAQLLPDFRSAAAVLAADGDDQILFFHKSAPFCCFS